MRVEQISVFLENKAGRLAEVTQTLSEAGVNIRALSLADTSDFGVLRMIVSDNKEAEEALKAQGFTVSKTDVVAVEVEDKPGGLHKILDLIQQTICNGRSCFNQIGIGDIKVCVVDFEIPELQVCLPYGPLPMTLSVL